VFDDDVLSDITEHLRDLQVTVKEHFPPVVEGFQWLRIPFIFLSQWFLVWSEGRVSTHFKCSCEEATSVSIYMSVRKCYQDMQQQKRNTLTGHNTRIQLSNIGRQTERRGKTRGVYKEIMDKEKKEWQDRNADNIKRQLNKKDTQQLWSRIRMMTQVRKQREDVGILQ
jgi:hypothetical protein